MASSARSPMADLTYDLVTVLQNKAKALEAYDRYLRDAGEDEEIARLFGELRREDERHVRMLKHALARRLDADVHLDDVDEMDAVELAASNEEEEEAYGGSGEEGPPPRRGESTHRRT